MNENNIKNLIAGLFVIFMVFVMIFIGFFLSGGFDRQQTRPFISNFKSISGLAVGSDVSYKGYKVGKVTDIEINKNYPELVSVYMQINDNIVIFKQTVATLQSVGITGQSKIELSLDISAKDTLLTPITITNDGSIPEIRSKASQFDTIVDKVNKIAGSLEQISEKFNKMLSDENMNKVGEITDNLNDLLYNLSNSSIYFNKTLMGLNKTMNNGQNTLDKFNNLVDRLDYDPSILIRGVQH